MDLEKRAEVSLNRKMTDLFPDPKTPPEIADLCEIKRELGTGTQGKVFLAVRKTDGVKMAVKQLLIDSVSTWKAYELFQREAETLQSIQMEGVAGCYGTRECLDANPPAVYLFQEFIEGESLEKMLAAGHRFSRKAIFEIAVQLTQILQRLHTHVPPIIHRDIKPSNVMVYQSGADYYRVTLIDFGAVANPQIQSGGSTVAGTYGYMPPEQLMGKPSPESDYFALGMLIVRMLSGVEPIDMPVADFRPVIEPYLEDQPDCVVGILRKMIEPNPFDRLSDPDVLIPVFQNYANEKFPPADVSATYNKKTFEQKLEAVRYFGQNGNISLWQQLAEKTPREIPKCYASIRIKKRISTDELVEIQEKSDEFNPDLIFMRIFCFSAMLIVFISFSFNIATMNIRETFVSMAIFIVICVALFATVFAPKGISKGMRHKRHKDVSLKDLDRRIKPEKLDSKLISVLLKYGRKSVAIISSIEYEPVKTECVDQFKTDKDETYLYHHGMPTFVLSYKFNPPDDADPEPLTHTIKIHFSPEGKIKVGDPLPILYYIDPDDSAYVVSMPFPYPLNDIASLKEICYRSFSRPLPKDENAEMVEV